MQYEAVPPPLLYVEDHPSLRKRLGYMIRKKYPHLQTASTIAEATELAAPGMPLCGIIADHHLPDGEGLELIRELRTLHGELPAALTTGELSRELANACSRERILYVIKPFGTEELAPLFELLNPPEDREFATLAERIQASPREAQVMRLVLIEERTNAMVAAELDLSPNTVKSCVRRILTKANARSMRALRGLLRAGSQGAGREQPSPLRDIV